MQRLNFSKLPILFAILVMPAILSAEKPAGTVVYFNDGNETYILLAEHANSSRGWAAFGGGDMEGESYLQTAVRKTHEETRGYFTADFISKNIDNNTPLLDGNYATFFVKIPFTPVPLIENKSVADSSKSDAYNERKKFAWIPLSVVKNYFEKDIEKDKEYKIDPAYLPIDRETDHLWPVWLKNMRKGLLQGKLPW